MATIRRRGVAQGVGQPGNVEIVRRGARVPRQGRRDGARTRGRPQVRKGKRLALVFAWGLAIRALVASPGLTDCVVALRCECGQVQPEKVSAASHFVNDLGLDSLDTVELVMAFEDEFAIEIPDADAEKILSCGDAVEYLASNTHAK